MQRPLTKIFFSKIWFEPIFSGSLAVWKECGEAAALALPRRAPRGEGKNSFELFPIYSASQDFSSG